MAVYSSALNASQISAIDNYAAATYGISAPEPRLARPVKPGRDRAPAPPSMLNDPHSKRLRACLGHGVVLLARASAYPDRPHHRPATLQRNATGEDHHFPIIARVQPVKILARLRDRAEGLGVDVKRPAGPGFLDRDVRYSPAMPCPSARTRRDFPPRRQRQYSSAGPARRLPSPRPRLPGAASSSVICFSNKRLFKAEGISPHPRNLPARSPSRPIRDHRSTSQGSSNCDRNTRCRRIAHSEA